MESEYTQLSGSDMQEVQQHRVVTVILEMTWEHSAAAPNSPMQPAGTWRMALGQGAPEPSLQSKGRHWLDEEEAGKTSQSMERPCAKAKRPKEESCFGGAACHALFLELGITGKAGEAGRCHAKAWL